MLESCHAPYMSYSARIPYSVELFLSVSFLFFNQHNPYYIDINYNL